MLGAKLPAQGKPTKEKKTWSNSSPVERVGGIVVLLVVAGVLVGGIWGLVALFSSGEDVSASTDAPTRTQVAPSPVSESVVDGCVAAALLKTMTEDFDNEGLISVGPGLMVLMVSTDNTYLNAVGVDIAETMELFSKYPDETHFTLMIKSFDPYIGMCQTLRHLE